jgi:hypothetical protein
MVLLSLYLGLEQLKDRTIKSSTMSQALCSTIILEFGKIFKIKLKVSYFMTLSNLLVYVVFLDPLQGKLRYAFSYPTSNALYGAHRYGDNVYILASINCKVKQWIQRDKAYNQIKMCICMDMRSG